jgi:hypothetical protein
MAVARKVRLRRGFGIPPQEKPDTPTPETRAKLRRDTVRALHEAGRLDDTQLAAALEIRVVLEAVGRGMFPTSGFGLTPGVAMQRRPGRDFLDRMSAEERRMWQRNYLPWTKAMAVQIAAALPPVRWLQLVLDIVIDNAGLRDVERRYALRHGTAADYLRQALEIYGR